eukprot:TRINITY_DN14498_c0_g1_i1.p1 TRINITY_DN14498_c0_g1~~TRINITY_DN14498_c0_g1_i1.p1  ORF type:complete len:358 (+),score=106.55 TRINITY_DN14498_c0_g1_i1:129-1202(+)
MCIRDRFFIANGLPHPKVIKFWDALPAAKSEIKGEMMAQERFPLYTKFCHLTTGNALSVVPTKTRADVEDSAKWSSWMDWLIETWDVRSDDWDRVWSSDFNSVVQTLKPGIMLQQGYTVPAVDKTEHEIKEMVGSALDPRQSFWLTQRLMVTQPTELKVEVIFGRAFVIQVAAGSGEEGERCEHGALITRDEPPVMKMYDGAYKQEVQQKPGCYEWILTGGYLEQVYAIAESAAKAAGIDALRIDVFLNRGQPGSVQINENSLSSAADYQWATPLLAKAWQEGHILGLSEIVDPGVDSHKVAHGPMWYSHQVLCDPALTGPQVDLNAVSYTHLRAHETVLDLVCRLLLEKKKKNTYN